MEEFKGHGSRSEAIGTPRQFGDDIKASLDRIFYWEASTEPAPQFSFDEIVKMLVQNPQLIAPSKRYLTEAHWAQNDHEASESALQKLAWALVENFAKVQL